LISFVRSYWPVGATIVTLAPTMVLPRGLDELREAHGVVATQVHRELEARVGEAARETVARLLEHPGR
jgi:hypothetical protein